MPRAIKLTWQSGTKGQSGRWRKKYKGRTYYFPGGRGRTDYDAYEAALEAWKKKKREIDGVGIQSLQAEYEKAIEKWEEVLLWCRKHGDLSMAAQAEAHLDDLRRRLDSVRIKPLTHYDRFEGRFGPPPEVLAQIVAAVTSDPLSEDEQNELRASLMRHGPRTSSDTETRRQVMQDAFHDPLRSEKLIWEDRLETQRRTGTSQDRNVSHLVAAYIAGKEGEASADGISVGRIYKLNLHLQEFSEWIGDSIDVSEITSLLLVEYKQHVLEKVSKGKWSRTTAADRMGTIRAFVRWLWQTEIIKSLPRVLDPKTKELVINTPKKKPIVFSNEELATLLGSAQARTKLYILLMLNCGMTQKDISDLEAHELDWDDGRIVRKRSKTRDHENVPEVSYKLWPETLELLTHEWSGDETGRVLLNRDGFPLWSERYEDGKYKKTDNIRNAFARLAKKTGVNKPLISLKKTSASRLRNNDKFNSVRSLFLGHAEVRVADQHYAENPKELLDRALEWLREELGIDQLQLKK